MVEGRRSFLMYQDLGVTAASGGRMRAQVMFATAGMTKPTGWHYHVCEGQFVYALKGWVDLEFEDGQSIRLQAGESLYIPGGLRHNEIATSDTLEISWRSPCPPTWARCRVSRPKDGCSGPETAGA
jgi:mannose-6-phosphate isomerase-like protein (cupin superfamily)